jgi:hypothetical protein
MTAAETSRLRLPESGEERVCEPGDGGVHRQKVRRLVRRLNPDATPVILGMVRQILWKLGSRGIDFSRGCKDGGRYFRQGNSRWPGGTSSARTPLQYPSRSLGTSRLVKSKTVFFITAGRTVV